MVERKRNKYFHLTFVFVLSLLVSSAQGIVQYERCQEYIYLIKAKVGLQGSADIILKATAGFEVLNNASSKKTELLLHVHDARMQQGFEEVDLVQSMNFGRWFSVLVESDGEIAKVKYPEHEDYDVITVKKTMVSYLSGKFKSNMDDSVYTTNETGTEGHHTSRYQRSQTSMDTVYVKKKHQRQGPLGSHGDVVSSKTMIISNDLRVPRKILLEENVKAFHEAKKGYRMLQPPVMGRGANLSVDHTTVGKEDQMPGIHLTSKGEVELIDRKTTNCDLPVRPHPLVDDSLAVTMTNGILNSFTKEDYTKNIVEIFGYIQGNITCVRTNRQKVVPKEKDCFRNLVEILEKIPDDNLGDIAYDFLNEERNNSKHNRHFHDDRLTMIDALASLRSDAAQQALYEQILNRSMSMETMHRALSHFVAYQDAPIPIIVDKLEELAFSELPPDITRHYQEKEYHRGVLLIYGAVANILYRHGNATSKSRAEKMVDRLEKKVGYHDPYHWHESRVRRSADKREQRDHILAHAVSVQALGSAALERSFEYLVSHMNHTDSPYTLRRAGIHALRHYTSEKAAAILLYIALFDEETSLRYEALKIYQHHPNAMNFYRIHNDLEQGFLNGTYPRCPKDIPDESVITLHHHEIVKRSVWKGIQFHLATPTVDWAKRFGNNKLGASMGLKIRNEIDIDIKLQRGHVKVDIDDHAYAIGHIGLMGIDLTVLDAKVCLIGSLEYELNLLQEFGFDEVKEFVKFWDRFQNGVVKNIKEGVERFRQFMVGVKDFTKTIKNLDKILDSLPRKVKNLRRIAIDAVKRIGEMDAKEVPDFAQPLLQVYNRIIELYNAIKSDVMDFYNTIVDIIKVQIPMSWRQIREGVIVIGSSVKRLFKAPKEAIAGIFKAIFKIKLGVQSLLDARNRTMDACFFLKDDKPYWWDLSGQLEEIQSELSSALKIFEAGIGPYLNSRVDTIEKEMRAEMINILRELHSNLTAPFKDLRRLAFPFVDGVRLFTTTVQDVREAFIQLKNAYQEAQSLINRLFGPKAYVEFPRQMRTSGGGCTDDGTYPASSRYPDPGVDLVAPAGKQMKSPFDGYLARVSDTKIAIYPDGSSFTDAVFYITNIRPREDIPTDSNRLKIYKSDIMGTVTTSACINHIHFSIQEGGGWGDPTRFLPPNNMTMPEWKQKCDEYYVIWLGRPLLYGSIIQSEETPDTSPQRNTKEPENVKNLPEPKKAKHRRRKRDLSDIVDPALVDKVTANWNKFKDTMSNFFDLPGDLGLDKFFKKFSIRNVRLGTMVGLLDKLGMDESKEDLAQLIHMFIEVTKAPVCLRPEQMTQEQLRLELGQRGIIINASREIMVEAYYIQTSKCPIWKPSLPERSFCQFDRHCLGMECCLDAKFGIFYKALKTWVRLDPCTLTISIGVVFYPYTWEKVLTPKKVPWGEEKEIMTGIKMKIFGSNYEMKIKYLFVNDKTTAMLNLDAAICHESKECLPSITIVKEMLLPLPYCKLDGTIVFPEISMEDFFSRENVVRELKKIKTNVKESSKQAALMYMEKKLGLPEGFLRSQETAFCQRPSRMTKTQLLAVLGPHAPARYPIEILRNMTKQNMTTCRWFSLPVLPGIVSERLFCKISEDCYRLDCCLDLDIPGLLDKSVSIRLFAHFDPCQFSFSYGFEHSNETKLLLDYRWGEERYSQFGAFRIKYVIGKLDKYFILDVGWSLCISGESHCILDSWILKKHRIPIPLCNKDFENCFTSVVPIRSLVQQGVRAVTEEASWTVLRCLRFDQYLLANHGCPNIGTCTTSLTPQILRTCQLGQACWSVQCNIRLNLFLLDKDVCVRVAFNPCSYRLEIGVGGWNHSTNLMRNSMGQVHEVMVKDTLKITLYFNKSPKTSYFVFDLGFAVCYRGECTDTQYVMKQTEIPKPFCNSNFTRNLPGGSMNEFLLWLGVNSTQTVAHLAVDRALTYLGIKQCLSDHQCVLKKAVTIDGWDNQCQQLSRLSRLPESLRCRVGSDCSSVSCCLEVDIKIWRGSLSFTYLFDPCNMKFELSFENCRKTVTLVELDKIQTVPFHENVTFVYLVESEVKKHGFLVTFRAYVCDIQCGWLTVMDKAFVELDCSKTAIKLIRRRRGVHVIDIGINPGLVKDNDPLVNKIGRKVPKLLEKFGNLVDEGKEQFKQEYNKIQERMGDLYTEMYGPDPTQPSIIINPNKVTENIRQDAGLLARPSPRWDWTVVPPSGGAELFGLERGKEGELRFVVGQGLTKAGQAILGDALANMTIGQLESTLDFENIDPVMAFKIIAQIRELYFKLVSEAIDVFFGGKLDDSVFNSFDYIIRGQMKFPQRSVEYFRYTYYFFVFPVPCLFSFGFGAEGYWGVNFYMDFEIISMLARGTVDPYTGLIAFGFGKANCVVFKGEVRLNGYIMETHLPSTAEIGFYKFPLDVGLNVDIVIIPLRFELVAEVQMMELFFMKRRKRGFRMRIRVRVRFRGIKRFARKVVRFVGTIIKGIVKLVKKIFKWRTLFRKVLWEWSMKPWRIPGIIKHKRKKDDMSPPQFNPPPVIQGVYASSLRSAVGCVVTQIPNRSPEEPAVLLRSDPVDDVSKVKMFYSVGTTPGGVNVVNMMNFNGPTTIIEGRLASRGPLYFTMTAKNSQGLTAQTTCTLPYYDVTLPIVEMDANRQTTSNPSFLQLNAHIFEDSPITQVHAAIGYGPGMGGDSVKEWHPTNFVRLLGPEDARGTRYLVRLTYPNLQLQHGQLHYFNIFVRNIVNYTAVYSSKPILTDFTPPEPPLIQNAASDHVIKDECRKYTLAKWQEFCATSGLITSSIPNHRIIVDGPGSKAIFNGQEPMKELQWTLNNHYISATFEPFHDYETRVRGYAMCLGTKICSCDAFKWFDPHESSASEHEWTFKGFAVRENKQSFADGTYYVTVTAINAAEEGGPYGTTVCHSQGQVVDTTPPEITLVGKMRYDLDQKRFSVYVEANDVHSALKEAQLGAGLSRHDLVVAPLSVCKMFPDAPKFYNGALNTKLTIRDGQRIYTHLLVVNNVGLTQDYTSPRPFLVDSTPPLPGQVLDGTGGNVGRKFFGLPQEMCVSWSGFSDPESGISHYQVIMGTCMTCSDLFVWTELAHNVYFICLPVQKYSFLKHNTRYFSQVTAVNGGHAGLSTAVQSKGMLYDRTPPVAGKVVDGTLQNMRDANYTSDNGHYSLQWTSSMDPESNLNSYRVNVIKRGHTGHEQALRTRIQVPRTANSWIIEGLHLQHADKLRAELVTENGAGLTVQKSTTGMVVDLTAPVIELLVDGTDMDTPTRYQKELDRLLVTFKANDPDSGIDVFKYHVFEYIQGRRAFIDIERTKDWKQSSRVTHIIPGLSLQPGGRYGVRITVINGAGVSSVEDSHGVIVDNTPPTIENVFVTSGADDQAEVHDGIVWLKSRNSIPLSVHGYDPESGIKAYLIAVGTTKGGQEMLSYREFPGKERLVITDINLTPSSTTAAQHIYYISVMAENQAGLRTATPTHALPIAILAGDTTGVVTIDEGPAQVDIGVVTATFTGFDSPADGIKEVAFGVGSEVGMDDVQGFTTQGIVNVDELDQRGNVHLPVSMKENEMYYVTIRALTNAENLLESSSTVFMVDRTSPVLKVAGDTEMSSSTNVTYIRERTSVNLQWEVYDDVGPVSTSWFILGHQPKSNDAPSIGQAVVSTANQSAVFSGRYLANQTGTPFYTRIFARDSVSLIGRAVTNPVVVDDSAPTVKEVACDPVINVVTRILKCTVSGVEDFESSLVSAAGELIKDIGSTETPYAVVYPKLNAAELHFRITDNINASLPSTFRMRIRIHNAAGMTATVYSGSILRDALPPSPGIVVELGDLYETDVNDDNGVGTTTTCNKKDECKQLDQECQTLLDMITVTWTPFSENQTRIIKYEVCLGTYPGGCDVVDFMDARMDMRMHSFKGLELQKVAKVYTSVRAHNEAGKWTTASSNGIVVSYMAAGRTPLKPVEVLDGPGPEKDWRYQADPTTLHARWDFSGEPCPMRKVEWSVERSDGLVMQNFTDMGETRSGVFFGLNGHEGETYLNIIRATSALGLTYTLRSSGVTIKLEPIIPGAVYDGPIIGHDLSMQASTDTLSANWQGFRIPRLPLQHSGNPSQGEEGGPNIEYYEVAIGTDRRYEKTKSNMVPFTRVGLNTTVSFDHLILRPADGVYYTTVRAHSRWFSMAEATSSGIRVGFNVTISNTELKHSRFINQSDILQVKWDPFKTSVGVQIQYVAVLWSNTTRDMTCHDIITSGVNSSEVSNYYNIHPAIYLHSTQTQTLLNHLYLWHRANCSVELIGVNSAGRCSKVVSWFYVDLTPPTTGPILVERFAEQQEIFFTRRRQNLHVRWTGFEDPDSGVKDIRIDLLKGQPGCGNLTSLRPVLLTDGSLAQFVVNGNTTFFEIDDILLELDVPYFVRITATNEAGGSSNATSSIILLQEAQSKPGTIRIGDDYTEETLLLTTEDNVTYNFLHMMSSKPLEGVYVPFKLSEWSIIKYDGLMNPAYPWSVLHDPSLVAMDGGAVDLSLVRLVDRKGVRAGAVSRPINIQYGGTYSFRLKAAPGPFAVTSAVIWDGPLETVGEFLSGREAQDPVQCACCFLPQINKTCACDCQRYMQGLDRTTPNPSGPSSKTDKETDWTLVDLEKVPDSKNKPSIDPDAIYNACGIQVHKNGSRAHLTLWCRSNVTGSKEEKVALNFDPSRDDHLYQIKIGRNVLNSWAIGVSVDGNEIVEITSGLPTMSYSARLIFHVWNTPEALPPIPDPFNPYSVSARVSEMRYPAPNSDLLRQGDPFSWNLPVSLTYFARLVALENNVTERSFIDWQKFATPCIPCLTPCSKLFCDVTCPQNKLHLITESFEEVNFTSIADKANITRFFVDVKAVSPDGYSVLSRSNPILVDPTPPEVDYDLPWLYFDAASKDGASAVRVQASNDTIRVQWAIRDPESGIQEFQWAIGSEPGKDDILDYEEVETQSLVEKTGLALENNHTYYVTVAAVNGAGVIAFLSDGDGILVLCDPPSADDVNVTLTNTRPVPEGVKAPNTVLTNDADTIDVQWSRPDDATATKIEFCVGSRPGERDDIVNCLPIETNSTSNHPRITIRDGMLEKNDEGPVANTSDLLRGTEQGQSRVQGYRAGSNRSPLHLEPGKHLHYHISVCNAAMKCSERPTKTVVIMSPRNQLVTVQDQSTSAHAAFAAAATPIQSFMVAALTQPEFSVEIKTNPGEKRGTSLLYGVVEDSQEFTSDAVVNYNSYIVRPRNTLTKLSRILTDRISLFLSPTIFVSPVVQVELLRPFSVTINIHRPPPGHDQFPLLIYWNTDQKAWHPVYETCAGKTPDKTASKSFTTLVCRTQNGARTWSDPVNSTVPQAYFKYETQMAVVYVDKKASNRAPVLLSKTTFYINATESPVEGLLRLSAEDPDGDPFEWVLGMPLPEKGIARLDPKTGLLMYRPRPGSVGKDWITIILRDKPTPPIESAQATYRLEINLGTSVNYPWMLLGRDGQLLTVENVGIVNRVKFADFGYSAETASCQKPVEFDLYGADLDKDETVAFQLLPLDSGRVEIGNVSKTAPVAELSYIGLPNPAMMYTWHRVHMIFYPNESQFGAVDLYATARDSSGHFSKVLQVEISLLGRSKCPARGWTTYFTFTVIGSVAGVLLVFVLIAFVVARRMKQQVPLTTVLPMDDTLTHAFLTKIRPGNPGSPRYHHATSEPSDPDEPTETNLGSSTSQATPQITIDGSVQFINPLFQEIEEVMATSESHV